MSFDIAANAHVVIWTIAAAVIAGVLTVTAMRFLLGRHPAMPRLLVPVIVVAIIAGYLGVVGLAFSAVVLGALTVLRLAHRTP